MQKAGRYQVSRQSAYEDSDRNGHGDADEVRGEECKAAHRLDQDESCCAGFLLSRDAAHREQDCSEHPDLTQVLDQLGDRVLDGWRGHVNVESWRPA